MASWQLQGGFGVEHLRRVDQDPGPPAPGELRLRMRAASLNFRDILMIDGQYDPRLALPLVPGSDGVGVVEAVGAGVEGVSEGDRVLPAFVQGWAAGPLVPGLGRTTLGGPRDGVLRTVMNVPAAATTPAPAHLSDAEAACLPCAGVTAWQALVRLGGLRAGDTVLTLGTGGVSLFALQLARLHGARVAITSSSDEKLERARALGADFTVNYRTEPRWGKAVAQWAGGGVDHVLELGGAGTLAQSLRAVRTGGHIAVIGVLAGVKTELPITSVLMRGIRLQGVFVGSVADQAALCAALSARPEVRPVVDRVFGFDELPAALAHLRSGTHMGKVVVQLDG